MTHPALSLVHLVRPPAPHANPAGARPPLLILLHGVGSNELSMARHADAFDPRLVVVSARSPLVLGPRSFAWFHVTFVDGTPQIVREEAEAGWAHIARFVDEAVAAYGADPARVFLGGFSQGAIMSLATLLTAPDQVAGVLAMSGRLLPEVLPHVAPPDALRGKAVLLLHGTADEKLGIHYARSARDTLATLPLELTYRELDMPHAVTRESLAVATEWLSERLG